MQGRSLW